jgi:hypothetical protein
MEIYIISILIQLALVVHIIRTGRNTFWIFVVIFAPLIGALAYFIIEILPGLGHSRVVHKANKAILDTVNPNRDVHQLTDTLAVANTVDNILNLANALEERGSYDDALALYAKVQMGMYKDDPYILLGKARVLYKKSDFINAKEALDTLIAKNPDFKSPEGHLLYAKSLEGIGEIEKALHEYEALNQYYAGPEPKCHYARLLNATGEHEKANVLFKEIVAASKRSGRHYNYLHKEWINIAKQSLK